MTPIMPQNQSVLKYVWQLLLAHRTAIANPQFFWRIVALFLAELTVFGSHRVTDLLRALQLHSADWTAWYRLFSEGKRLELDKLSATLLQQTLPHVSSDQPYVIAIDGTSVPRCSDKIEGSGWLKCPRNPPWNIGIHRAQRFLNLSWLAPLQNGYSRAVPLRFLPAFTEKSPRQATEAVTEHAAGSEALEWVGKQLKQLGHGQRQILCLADGSFDNLAFWKGLKEGVTVLVRTAKNRAFCHLPPAYSGRGRKRTYGDAARKPQAWLAEPDGWTQTRVAVRGRERKMNYRVEGPYLRRGMTEVVLFLIVVRGEAYGADGHRKRREPVYYSVNGVSDGQGGWKMPMAVEDLLAWAWQRWEVEVVHREVKSLMGLGDKQCWTVKSAISSVQWSAWVYGILMLAGVCAQGVDLKPARVERWQRHARRWTISTVLNDVRAEMQVDDLFSRLLSGMTPNWHEKRGVLAQIEWRWPFKNSKAA